MTCAKVWFFSSAFVFSFTITTKIKRNWLLHSLPFLGIVNCDDRPPPRDNCRTPFQRAVAQLLWIGEEKESGRRTDWIELTCPTRLCDCTDRSLGHALMVGFDEHGFGRVVRWAETEENGSRTINHLDKWKCWKWICEWKTFRPQFVFPFQFQVPYSSSTSQV